MVQIANIANKLRSLLLPAIHAMQASSGSPGWAALYLVHASLRQAVSPSMFTGLFPAAYPLGCHQKKTYKLGHTAKRSALPASCTAALVRQRLPSNMQPIDYMWLPGGLPSCFRNAMQLT